MMFRRLTMLITACALSHAAHALECADMWSLINKACSRVSSTWREGKSDLMLSGYAYHLRSTYTEEKLRELNEKAWGIGYGRTKQDEDGDTHTVFGFGFWESHRKIQWNFGYLYQTYWGQPESLRAGLGYTVMIVQRPDIAGGVPIPAALPVASLEYKRATLMATFIPTLNNGINNGSVLYVFGKYRLD